MNTVEKILNLIKERGIHQKKFLSDLGLDESKISEWKKGKTTSYKNYIVEIADYFGVTTDYLLRDGEEKQNFELMRSEEKEMETKRFISKETNKQIVHSIFPEEVLSMHEDIMKILGNVNAGEKNQEIDLKELEQRTSITKERIMRITSFGDIKDEDFITADEYESLMIYFGKRNQKTMDYLELLKMESDKTKKNSKGIASEIEAKTGTDNPSA